MPAEQVSLDSLLLDHASVTLCGARASNQDVIGEAHQDDLSCFVLCDGVGGHEGGEIAASLVVDAVRTRFLEEGAFGARALYSYVNYAAECVAAKQSQERGLEHMSATVVALLIDRRNRCATWMHVGDTRLYLFRGGVKHAVTKDHSVAQQFIDAGFCKADALAKHPRRGQLFAAIGAAQEGALPFPVSEIALASGDAFLICTDGLWEQFDEKQLEEGLARSRNAGEWLGRMKMTFDNNDPAERQLSDNCSAIAVWISN